MVVVVVAMFFINDNGDLTTPYRVTLLCWCGCVCVCVLERVCGCKADELVRYQ